MSDKLPSTSIEAYKKVTPEMLQGHYGKILKALKILGTANYEKIANAVGLDKHQVGRRLSEMEEEGRKWVHKPGTTSLTKSGRKAFDYSLTGVVPEEILPDYKKPNPVGRPANKTSEVHNPLFD